MNITSFFTILSFICLLLYSITNLGKTIEENNKALIKNFLDKFTFSTISSFLTGIFICLFTQSSSIITILTISLISGKVLSLKRGLAIIIGSNIGTSFISFFISLEIGAFYYLFFILSFVFLCFNKKQASSILIYIGLIFLSLNLIKTSLLDMFNENLLSSYLKRFEDPFLGIISGTIISFIIQSSAATIALTQNMQMDGLITTVLGISIMLGANLGTTFSGVLFSIGSSIDAKRIAVGSLLFNLFGVIITIPFLYIYKERILLINSSYLVSSMHIYFNIITGIIGIFFINPLTSLTKKLVKEKDIK